jgi:xanthine dehydrogenase accessory factor
MVNTMKVVRLDTSIEQLLERQAGAPSSSVLATIVSTIGSTYRKAGARMLIEAGGRITGLLSGGCFEQDLRAHAAKVFSTGIARAVIYDTRDDDDLIFGIGAGCEGVMRILLEPAQAGSRGIRALAAASVIARQGGITALATIHEGAPGELGTYLETDLVDQPVADACAVAVRTIQSQSISWGDNQSREAWIQVVAPPPAILICGAGADAEPVVAALRALRFPVTIVDHRPAYGDLARFPGSSIVVGPAADLADNVDLKHYFAAVIMSHHLPSDAKYLQAIAASDINYVGLLGPRLRRAKLVAEIGDLAQKLNNRLRGPVGLDIGAVTPEGIALAIVAELHAVAAFQSVELATTGAGSIQRRAISTIA